tara:strand:+ start:549 stop:1127 length:579 start_codon:yes stop_codon:yes gene_type:complete
MSIIIWLFIGFVGWFFIASSTWYPKYLQDNFEKTQMIVYALLGPFPWIFLMLRPFVWTFPKFIYNSIYNQIHKARTKKINLERSNQRKINTEERKSKAIKNYPTLLSNCEEIISSYQESDIPINISFYNDCITLISYANQKLSEDILSRKALLDILKFARINIFTFLENEDEEKVQKISNSLAKSIKKFSKK